MMGEWQNDIVSMSVQIRDAVLVQQERYQKISVLYYSIRQDFLLIQHVWQQQQRCKHSENPSPQSIELCWRADPLALGVARMR